MVDCFTAVRSLMREVKVAPAGCTRSAIDDGAKVEDEDFYPSHAIIVCAVLHRLSLACHQRRLNRFPMMMMMIRVRLDQPSLIQDSRLS